MSISYEIALISELVNESGEYYGSTDSNDFKKAWKTICKVLEPDAMPAKDILPFEKGRQQAFVEALERMNSTIEHCSNVLPDLVDKRRLLEILRTNADWLKKATRHGVWLKTNFITDQNLL